MSSDVQDVEESLRILVSTLPGERAMRPDFGAGFQDLLFESMDTSTQTLFFDRVKTAITRYEPRVEVINIWLDTTFLPEGRVAINVEYEIRGANTRFNFVYPYYLTEGSRIEQP